MSIDLPPLAAEPGAGFAERIKRSSRAEHERAESAGFVVDLMAGRLELAAYAAMAGQLRAVYAVLEEAALAQRGDPVAGRFVFDSLTRTPALDADLAWLLGGRAAAIELLPATRRYVDRLRAVAFDWPGGFVAHHYTRYLGDLSGGAIIRNRLRSVYGLELDGVRFYVFDEIAKPKPFKDAYRRLLDEAPWDAGEQQRVLDEVDIAFRLNRALFDDLDRTVGRARADDRSSRAR